MTVDILAEYLMNGLMLAMIYSLVAVGFTLFFGVLDIINFAHGDVFMVGAFAALAAFNVLSQAGIASPVLLLCLMVLAAIAVLSLIGVLSARYLVLPLKRAPALNVLLMTMMLGTILREGVRLFYPAGASPKAFPALLPTGSLTIDGVVVRIDNLIMLGMGITTIVGVHLLINRTKLGLAIRAVSQDEETARMMGINYTFIVMLTFALGSALAAVAGTICGLYYNEVNFSMGLMMGAIGFSAAIIGGLGSIYGALLGGAMFALLQALGAVAMPFASAYKDVFAFAVVIIIMTWRPTGLISTRESERV
ncbi:MAG: branched-chain amino acid ABC transporter permease [Xanthobacteraceae bacterium]